MRLRLAVIAGLFVTLFASVAFLLWSQFIANRNHVLEIPGPGPAGFPDAPPKLSARRSGEAATTSPANETPPPPVPAAATKLSDADPQEPLENPPEMIKAIYATSWSAGSKAKMDYLIDLLKTTELNAIVIDVKDFSGLVAYATDLSLPKEYRAVELRIPKVNVLLKRLHSEGIYAIARISVFQDERLALARPDLGLMSSTTGMLWRDHKNLPWIDVAAREAWDYNIAIAREALERGFDEVNFDYVRFAADGDLSDIRYPFWDMKTSRRKVLKDFWEYVRNALPGKRLSVDLFGLTTVNTDDLGIGQKLENAFPYFDDIAPMLYPSHYYSGTFNFKSPADHPYEVVTYSMEAAIRRLKTYNKQQITDNLQLNGATSTTPITNNQLPITKFRPWLQDFDLGANYDATMVRKEIQAVYDAASSTPELLGGWMLWNPSNVYTREALLTDN